MSAPPDPIICPCGAPATYEQPPGAVHDLGWGPHFDGEGRQHHHDPNHRHTYYECRDGHVFWSEGPTCWCGWPTDGARVHKHRNRDSPNLLPSP